VERELVLRLAGLLWRLRRAATIETGLFEIQADHLRQLRQAGQLLPASRDVAYALFRRAESIINNREPASHRIANTTEAMRSSEPNPTGPAIDPALDLARCFLRLANLPNFALDRLSRYEATLWRQAGRILRLWIAANHKKEDTASVSMIAQNWRRLGATITDFRGKQFAGLRRTIRSGSSLASRFQHYGVDHGCVRLADNSDPRSQQL
jgi:hypothetical protein